MEARPHHKAPVLPDGPSERHRSGREAASSSGPNSGPNKVQRIGSQTKGLFEDFKAWVELRLKLVQLDVQEKIQRKLDAALIKAAPIVVGALAGLFLLVTAALFIGWALGHPAWGFLVITGLLLAITLGLYARSRRLDDDTRDIDVTPRNGTGTRGGDTP